MLENTSVMSEKICIFVHKFEMKQALNSVNMKKSVLLCLGRILSLRHGFIIWQNSLMTEVLMIVIILNKV